MSTDFVPSNPSGGKYARSSFVTLYLLYFKVIKRAPFRNILDVSRVYYLLKKEEGENGKFQENLDLFYIHMYLYFFSFQNKSKNVIKLYKHDKLVL